MAPVAKDLPSAKISQTLCTIPSNSSHYFGPGEGPQGDLSVGTKPSGWGG